jgi:hypothetical protein
MILPGGHIWSLRRSRSRSASQSPSNDGAPGRVVRAQVVVSGGIQADQSLLPKLHHSNPGEGLVMEAIRKTVSSVTGVCDAMSATPWLWKDRSDPWGTTMKLP